MPDARFGRGRMAAERTRAVQGLKMVGTSESRRLGVSNPPGPPQQQPEGSSVRTALRAMRIRAPGPRHWQSWPGPEQDCRLHAGHSLKLDEESQALEAGRVPGTCHWQ